MSLKNNTVFWFMQGVATNAIAFAFVVAFKDSYVSFVQGILGASVNQMILFLIIGLMGVITSMALGAIFGALLALLKIRR